MKNLSLIILSVGMVTGLFSGCTDPELEKKLAIVEMDNLFKAGEFEKAKEQLEQYLPENADNEYAWTLMGHIYTELDNESLAYSSYNKALKINNETVEALTGLGILARKKGDYDEAAKYYNQAIKIKPSYAQAYSSMVVVELKRNNFDQAVEMGQKGFDLDPEDPIIIANLSIAYHYQGDTINRDKYYDLAAEIGYSSIDILPQIFDGTLTILD